MSATNMKLFLLLGFSLLLYHEIEGITTHSVTECSNNINISCNNTDKIHVERITYYNGTDCNQAVTDLQVCGQPVTGSDTGLVPYCNGKISCREILDLNYCPDSKAAKVDYRCIPGITTHSVTECSNNINISCNNTDKIHVERITYYNGTDCNQAVTDLQVCGQPLTDSDKGLVPYCNGKISCREILDQKYCPGSKAAKVDYRCIPGNEVKGMCEEFIIENTNRIFLSTPNFPSRPNFTDISPCRCSIRGASIKSIQIQILELTLQKSNDGTKSSLEIKYGDVTYKAESFRLVINERLSTESTTAEIIFNHNGINREYLWIEVQGVSMHVSCNTYANNVRTTSSPSSSTSSTTTTTTHPPQTPDLTSHSQDKDTIIIFAVLLSLCILIVCIQTIIILLRKPPGRARQRNRGGEPGESEEGTCLSNDSGSDGNLVELNSTQ